MTEPRRLLSGEGTEFERSLLRAGEAEEVPADVSTRMAAVLGIGAGSLPSHPPPAGGGMPAGAVGAHPAWAGLLKVGAVLAVVGGVVAGWVLWGDSSTGDLKNSESSRAQQALTQVTPAVADVPRGEIEPIEAMPPILEPKDLAPAPNLGDESPTQPSLESGSNSAPSRERGRTSAPLDRRSAGDVAAEVKLLDRARQAVAAGNDERAKQLLSQYAARFPKGVLRHEARVLREVIDGRGAN